MIIKLMHKNVTTWIDRSTIILMQSDHNKRTDAILTTTAPLQGLPYGTIEKIENALAICAGGVGEVVPIKLDDTIPLVL